MRLKSYRQPLIRPHLPNRRKRRLNLPRMMSVIVNINQPATLRMYVKSPGNPFKQRQCLSNLFRRHSYIQSHRDCSRSILHVHPPRETHPQISYLQIFPDIIKQVAPIIYPQPIGIIIRFLPGSIIPGNRSFLQFQPLTQKQLASCLQGKFLESLDQMLVRPVYIQMIRIHSRDYRNLRMQMQKGTIILVRLDHHVIRILINQQIRTEIRRNSS